MERAEFYRKVGRFLRSKRIQAGLRQTPLATKLGYTSRYRNKFVSQVENGQARVPADRVEAWEEAVGIPRGILRDLLAVYDATGSVPEWFLESGRGWGGFDHRTVAPVPTYALPAGDDGPRFRRPGPATREVSSLVQAQLERVLTGMAAATEGMVGFRELLNQVDMKWKSPT